VKFAELVAQERAKAFDNESYLNWYNRVSSRYPAPSHIEWLIEHYIDRVISGDCQRLIISMPPQHVKSDAITRKLPVYWGQNCPGDNILITGYSQRFAEKYLSEPARDLADELGVLAKGSTALDSWKFTTGGTVVARGVGAPPTGIPRLKLIIIDDPIKSRAEAESEVERENVWSWYRGSIIQRFWEDTRVIIIATRWHEDDLIGRLLEEEVNKWEVVNLPALAEMNDVLGRAEGEALWPEFKSVEFLLDQKKDAGEYEFEALFQGNPTPLEGSLFKVGRIGRVRRDEVPHGGSVMAFDLGSTVAGDWTAFAQGWKCNKSGKFFFDVDRCKKEPYDRNSWARLQVDSRKPSLVIGPEDPGSGGKEAGLHFARAMAGHNVEIRKVTGSKESRATPLASMVNAGLVCVVDSPTANAFIEELRQFPGGKHDDMVDAASDVFNELAKTQAIQKKGSRFAGNSSRAV